LIVGFLQINRREWRLTMPLPPLRVMAMETQGFIIYCL
jgi:hypothetical protein